MVDSDPVGEPFNADDPRPLPTWAEARRGLAGAEWYWLATARPDGIPHVMPVLAVWVDDALHFSTGGATRKGKNLARDSHCVVTAASPNLHLVVEGKAARVTDEVRLQRVAGVYASKYGWQVTIRDGAWYADGAPTAGPPPYEVYGVSLSTVFAFGTDESLAACRWRW